MQQHADIYIPGLPIPWKAPYVGTHGAYSSRTGVMNDLKLYVKANYKGPYFIEQINCSLKFYMPIPKGTSKKKRALMLNGTIRPAKVPDRANLCKFYEDVIQGIAFANDSQIVGGFVEKWYGEEPHTLIHIESV